MAIQEWFRVAGTGIEPVIITDEGYETVTVNGVKVPKRSEWASYFQTEEEAQEFLSFERG